MVFTTCFTSNISIPKSVLRRCLVPLFASTAVFTCSTYAFDTGDGEFLNRLYWRDFEEIQRVENGEFISGTRVVDESRRNHTIFIANTGPQVTQISADLKVTEVINKGASPEARIIATIFNDGSAGPVGAGDILPILRLSSNEEGTALIGSAVVFRCADEECLDGDTLLFDDTTFGNFPLNTATNVSITWDTAQFLTFNVGGTTLQVDVLNDLSLAVNVADFPFGGIGTSDFGIDDRMDDSYIKAAFDNVMYNGALHDDFSSAELDPNKWDGGRLERERFVDAGKIVISQRNVGENRSNTLNLARPNSSDFIQTDINVQQVFINNTRARARVTGFWYNDGSQPGVGGEAGEVQAEIRMIEGPGPGFEAEYFIERCDNFDCSASTGGGFMTPAGWQPQIGQTHTLSIERNGTDFEFCFDGLCEQAVSPFPDAGPSNFEFFKGIGTRIDQANDPTDEGSITAHFDNVQFSKFPSFGDVPMPMNASPQSNMVLAEFKNIFFTDIEKLFASGVTGGCSVNPPLYCPDSAVTRGQMAAFMERALTGHFFSLPAATGMVFNDVPMTDPFASSIEQFAADGITGGCSVSPPLYCTGANIRRVEMVIFLLRAKFGSSFNPSPATGTMFADVGASDFGANFVEEAAAQGITGGCDAMNFCPNDPVTRGQMAAFIKRTFEL